MAAAGLLLAAGCGSKTGDADVALSRYGRPHLGLRDDNGVYPVDGRTGGWYTYGDDSGLGTLDPPEGGWRVARPRHRQPELLGAGHAARHLDGFADWGSAIAASTSR